MMPLELLRRLRDRFRRERLTRELDEELRLHRALLERDRVAGDTHRQLGNLTRYREETRDMWSLGWFDDLLLDLRFVFRALRSEPAFSLVVTLTLALGIGASVAMYSVIDGVLLEPLPYPAPASLVQLTDVQDQDREAPASYPEYLDWKERTAGILSAIGVSFRTGEVLQGADGAEQLRGARVSVNMPAMLGIRPIHGRTFRPDEEGVGAPRVVILGEALWRSHFGSDPGIIGRTITLTGQPYVVIGVFPSAPNVRLPTAAEWSHAAQPAFWLPLRLDEKSAPRTLHWLDVLGRLRPHVTLEQARARAAAVAASIGQDEHIPNGVHLNPLAPVLVGVYRQPLELLMAASALLMLIACANVASLLLTRTALRTREFAVRTALGAGQGRLFRLVLAESLVRAAIGGLLGVGLAVVLVGGMRAWLGDSLPRLAEASIDGRVLAVAVAVTVVCGLALGIVPAVRARSDAVAGTLRGGGRGMACARCSWSARSRCRSCSWPPPACSPEAWRSCSPCPLGSTQHTSSPGPAGSRRPAIRTRCSSGTSSTACWASWARRTAHGTSRWRATSPSPKGWMARSASRAARTRTVPWSTPTSASSAPIISMCSVRASCPVASSGRRTCSRRRRWSS